MWVKFLLNNQPYRVGDVVDWQPDESARRLMREGLVEETVSPEEAAKMEAKKRKDGDAKKDDEKVDQRVGPNADDVPRGKDAVAPANTAAVAPVRKG